MDKRNHFLRLIFKCRARHKQHALCTFTDFLHIHRTSCLWIFNVMCLVYNQKRKLKRFRQIKMCCCLEGCYSYTTSAYPWIQCFFSARTMNFYNLQSAHFTNFSAPICNDARRAHNCKMRCPCVFQRYHRGDCLYGFTKSHFISEKNALLVQCIFNAPFLVTTQLAQQTIREKTFLLYFSCEFFRQSVYWIIVTECSRDNIFKSIEKRNRMFGKFFPSIYPVDPLCVFKYCPLFPNSLTIVSISIRIQKFICIHCFLFFSWWCKYPLQSFLR